MVYKIDKMNISMGGCSMFTAEPIYTRPVEQDPYRV